MEPRFQEAFVEAIPLPHAVDGFPHLAEVLAEAAALRRARVASRMRCADRNRRRQPPVES